MIETHIDSRVDVEKDEKVELPIVYRRASAYFAAFPCPMTAIVDLLPASEVTPVPLWPGAATLVVAVFDYQETSIGPYGEVALAIPCRRRGSFTPPLLPLLAERWLEDMAYWVALLPVTTARADQVGRTIWGYPKFVSDIDIKATDSRVDCLVSEHGDPILRIEIQRPRSSRPIEGPLRTYSRLGDELLLTTLAFEARGAVRRLGARARLRIEDHPRTAALAKVPAELARPVEVRWFDTYRTELDRARARFRIGR